MEGEFVRQPAGVPGREHAHSVDEDAELQADGADMSAPVAVGAGEDLEDAAGAATAGVLARTVEASKQHTEVKF